MGGKGKGKGAAEHFDEATLEVYKECFRLMDIDKDGVINKTDLRAAFDNVGRLVMDDELNSMLSEVGGSCNYDNMIKMFEAKMAGGVNDPDELVVNAFKAFDMEVEEKIKGQMVTRHIIDREEFTHILMNFGEKMTQDEIDDIYGEFDFDDNKDILPSLLSTCSWLVQWTRRRRRRRKRRKKKPQQQKEVKREQLRRSEEEEGR